jgi:serine phosphatase RsbU (regulator of sigma subunit)
MPVPSSQPTLYLVPVAGPAIEPLALPAHRPSLRLGRVQCELALPATESRVSRTHARFDFDGTRWRLTDLNSRWGTYVNGVRLPADGGDLPLGEGDLIRISPWTFMFSSSAERQDSVTTDDAFTTQIRNVSDARLLDDQLGVLLESTAAIHSARDENELASLLIDAACRGTGLINAAVLRPVDAAGRVQVIASKFRTAGTTKFDSPGDPPRYSRSLLAAAANGQVAEIQSGGFDTSESIVSMNITAALCVPIVLGGGATGGGAARNVSDPLGGVTVAAYLYLDSRGPSAPRPRPNAAAFCVALGRMTSLALAGLKRVEIERRQAVIESELNAAAAVQRWILPQRTQCVGAFDCTGESRPGRFVGGDFFDLIDLGEDRIAVTLGDVTGKGVAAGVLMTATQGFLHASLLEHGDVTRAVTAVNRYVSTRSPDERFVTAWVGVADRRNRTLTYIDAGHGYAILHPADGEPISLTGGDGLPIGVEADFPFRSVTIDLPPSGRLMVVSDGLIEQTGLIQTSDGRLEQDQFGLDAVKRTLTSCPMETDAVDAVFAAVVHHAGSTQLADDATAVLVKW